MKSIKLVSIALAVFILTSAMATAVSFNPDNFNDNNKSIAWGTDILVEGTGVFLTETNMHLEFTGTVVSNATILRPWQYSLGSYTQNWEVAADVNVGALSLPQNVGVQMFLAVAEYGDVTLGDHLAIGIGAESSMNGIGHGYEMTSAVGGADLTDVPNYGFTSTGDQQGRVRVAFDASTKILTASYNGIPLGSLDVDNPATSWNMTAGSSFAFVLGGSMWGDYTNSSSEVYADNFEVRSGNALAYLLTVNNGTGSGNYTNNAGVNITASNAPAGQVFDHWVGSTQYLASVTSATTTVTMPAQAIALTPAYKLSGTASGDDFDDNTKDPAKWGDDISFMNTNAGLMEANGQLELRKPADVDAAGVLRPWIQSVGSYTQSWEVSVNVGLGDIALPAEGTSININLAVANRQDTNLFYGVPIGGDALDIALDLYHDQDGIHRGYEMTSRLDGNDLMTVPNYGYISTGDHQGTLKIAFDSLTKVLTASYNGNVLGLVDVDAPGSDWQMTDSDTFGFALIGAPDTMQLGISAGEVYADNFTVTGAVAPPSDADGNGLPDWWEQQYFGSTGVDPNAGCSNGINTRIEAYVAGLDPTNPNAFFGVTDGDPRSGWLQWNAVSGRVYTVWWSTNLLDGFQTLETNYTGGAITDTLHRASGKCFYKLDVRLP